jgi:hypothetical protein
VWNYNIKDNSIPAQKHELDHHLKEITGLKIDESEQFLISTSLDGTLIVWHIEMSQIVYTISIGEKIFELGCLKNDSKIFYLKLQNDIRLFTMHLHVWPFAVLGDDVCYVKKLPGFMNIPSRIVCLQENGIYKYISPIYGGCLAIESLEDIHKTVFSLIEFIIKF